MPSKAVIEVSPQSLSEIIHQLSQEEFAVFGYAIRACEHYNEDRIRKSTIFEKRCTRRNNIFNNLKNMVLSGETGQILKEEMNVGEEFFPNCFKDGKFSIDCQRSDYLRINTSRTVWVSSEKSFIIEVRWDPGTLLNNSKEMFRTRFLVAHELGHILLHSSGQPRIPFYSGRCRPEQEQEADSFARSLVDLDFDWMCDSIHHTLCSLTNADKVEVITEIEAERKDCGLKYKIQ